MVSLYFEVCVNYGRWQRRLGEINVSDAYNDGLFFDAIKKRHNEVRRQTLSFLLEPRDIRYVRVY